MMFSIVLVLSALIFMFFLNRYRHYCYWAEFTKLYGYIRIAEDPDLTYEEKSMFWEVFQIRVKGQRTRFLLYGYPKLTELPEELQPKAKIFDFQKHKEAKKSEEK